MSFVFDHGCQERHSPTIGRGDATLVDHSAQGVQAVGGKTVVAVQEIGITDGQARCHQAAHIHLAATAKHNARRVDQHDLAIGRQATHDLRGVLRLDAVERHSRCRRLYKVHTGIGTDVEAAPVGDHAGGVLVDRHGGTLSADGAAA